MFEKAELSDWSNPTDNYQTKYKEEEEEEERDWVDSYDELQKEKKSYLSIVKDIISNNYKFALCFVALFTTVMVFYLPYHNNREHEYIKHEEFLYSGICDNILESYETSNRTNKLKILSEIEILNARFKGTEMNCNTALLYTNIPIVLGACGDLWKASFIHTIITGGTWEVKLVLALSSLLFVWIASKMIISLAWTTAIGSKISPVTNTVRIGKKNIAVIKTSRKNNNNLIQRKK